MTSYYVDQDGGSDSNSGTASGQAWKTLDKVDDNFYAGTFGAGDSINFQGGDTWTHTDADDVLFIRDCSGSSGNEFVIQAYGTGRPVIDGNGVNSWALHRSVSWPSADHMKIRVLELTGSGVNCIQVQELEYLEIDDVYVHDAERGIQIRDGNHILVQNCTVDTMSEEGIYFGNAASYTLELNYGTISNCTVSNTRSNGIDMKQGCYDCLIEDCVITDCGDWEPAALMLGGARNIVQRVYVTGSGTIANRAFQNGAYMAGHDPSLNYTGHVVRECTSVGMTADEGGMFMYGDANQTLNCAFIDGSYGIGYLNSAGLGTSTKQKLRGNYFSGNSDDDICTETTSMLDSDYNCYADAGSWEVSSTSRSLSYVRAVWGFEENSRSDISIDAGTSVYVNDIENVTSGGGMIYVDVTYRIGGEDQHRTSHMMRLNNSAEWVHELLMNLKLYISEDSDFSGRGADERDTNISTDSDDPEGILADSAVAALVGAETWLYYNA